MGRMQRLKGANFERLIANRLKEIWPGAKRGIGQTRCAKEVADVEGTPWWIELKHRILPNLWAALLQASTDSDGRPPLVIARRNGGPDVVVMLLDDFMRLAVASSGMAISPVPELPLTDTMVPGVPKTGL